MDIVISVCLWVSQ